MWVVALLPDARALLMAATKAGLACQLPADIGKALVESGFKGKLCAQAAGLFAMFSGTACAVRACAWRCARAEPPQ